MALSEDLDEGYPQGVERTFVPRFRDNHKDPVPCVVTMVTPYESTRRKVLKLMAGAVTVKTDENGELPDDALDGVEIQISADQTWQEFLVRECVRKVTHYLNKGKQIQNGNEAAKFAHDGWIQEVGAELYGEASLDEEKKTSSEPSSDAPPDPSAEKPKEETPPTPQ